MRLSLALAVPGRPFGTNLVSIRQVAERIHPSEPSLPLVVEGEVAGKAVQAHGILARMAEVVEVAGETLRVVQPPSSVLKV